MDELQLEAAVDAAVNALEELLDAKSAQDARPSNESATRTHNARTELGVALTSLAHLIAGTDA